jgi:hypothetical protein
MNEVKQKIKPKALVMKEKDIKTGTEVYKIIKFRKNQPGCYYTEEDWEEMTEEEKKEWGIE